MLQRETTFPYDVLDEIFCFACEGTPRRAMALSTVCRFWHDRIVRDDRMWRLLLRSTEVRVGQSWELYGQAVAAHERARQLRPLPPEELHPIEDCTLEYACPMFAENLSHVADGLLFCGVCKQNVYQVLTQKELEEQRKLGHCVMIQQRDVAPDAIDNTVYYVALVAPTLAEAKALLRHVVASAKSWGATRTGWLDPYCYLFLKHGDMFRLCCMTVEDAFALRPDKSPRGAKQTAVCPREEVDDNERELMKGDPEARRGDLRYSYCCWILDEQQTEALGQRETGDSGEVKGRPPGGILRRTIMMKYGCPPIRLCAAALLFLD